MRAVALSAWIACTFLEIISHTSNLIFVVIIIDIAVLQLTL